MKNITLIAIAVFSLASTSAFADAPVGFWKTVDPDGKGFVTKDAYMAYEAQRFADMDTNHDGKVSKDEMKTYYDQRDAQRAQSKGAAKKY